jgi:hypothetical protein
MGESTILSFNLSEPANGMLSVLCDGLGLRLSVVPKADFARPLGTLLGLPCAQPVADSAADFDDPMLVMCNLDETQFNAFLQALRYSGLPRIDLKAVLTPTNIAWNAAALHDELTREHLEMQRRHGHR